MENLATWSDDKLVSRVLGTPVQIDSIKDVMTMAPQTVANVGKKRIEKWYAMREMVNRLMVCESEAINVIHGPEDVAHYLFPRLRFLTVEKFCILILNTKNHILHFAEVSTGSLTASIVHPREVFKIACTYSAAAIVLTHNHPSGDPSPSQEDIAVTQRIVKAGKIMDIPVLDHIIIGDNRFVSLKEKGLLK